MFCAERVIRFDAYSSSGLRVGTMMELGVLSYSLLVQREHGVYLQLLSALARQPGANIISPPPLEWKRRKEWGSARRQIGDCDALFWVQTSSRPPLAIEVATWMNLRARRSTFVASVVPCSRKDGFARFPNRSMPALAAAPKFVSTFRPPYRTIQGEIQRAPESGTEERGSIV